MASSILKSAGIASFPPHATIMPTTAELNVGKIHLSYFKKKAFSSIPDNLQTACKFVDECRHALVSSSTIDYEKGKLYEKYIQKLRFILHNVDLRKESDLKFTYNGRCMVRQEFEEYSLGWTVFCKILKHMDALDMTVEENQSEAVNCLKLCKAILGYIRSVHHTDFDFIASLDTLKNANTLLRLSMQMCTAAITMTNNASLSSVSKVFQLCYDLSLEYENKNYSEYFEAYAMITQAIRFWESGQTGCHGAGVAYAVAATSHIKNIEKNSVNGIIKLSNFINKIQKEYARDNKTIFMEPTNIPIQIPKPIKEIIINDTPFEVDNDAGVEMTLRTQIQNSLDGGHMSILSVQNKIDNIIKEMQSRAMSEKSASLNKLHDDFIATRIVADKLLTDRLSFAEGDFKGLLLTLKKNSNVQKVNDEYAEKEYAKINKLLDNSNTAIGLMKKARDRAAIALKQHDEFTLSFQPKLALTDPGALSAAVAEAEGKQKGAKALAAEIEGSAETIFKQFSDLKSERLEYENGFDECFVDIKRCRTAYKSIVDAIEEYLDE